MMAEYKANYRCVWKTCPSCGQLKSIPTRNTFCSKECASRREALNSEDASPSSRPAEYAPRPQIDVAALAAQITAQVLKSLPPELLGLGKPSETLNWTKNTFDDGMSVIISDVHIPYEHRPACLATLKFLRELSEKGLLKRLFLNGDIFDAASLSRHMKSRRAKYPQGDLGSEMKEGMPLINAFAELFPETWFLGGNHEEGRLQRVLANEGVGIPADPLAMGNLLDFYGYRNIEFVDRREICLGFDEGEVWVFHGEKYNKHTAASILEKNRYRNTVQGHTHRPQLFFVKGSFGMVNGNLFDKEKQDYMADPDWTMGFSILEHFNNGTQVNPYFVKITEDGEFAYNGKKYTSDGVKL
jgi:UDP-2,3-diacylglucosamine pyrophosphatase LpxH